MAFTREHVQQVRNGHPRQVGVLPDSVWRALEWPCPWVYLGQSGLSHIERDHKDVSEFDLLWLPLAIASGIIVHEQKDPRKVIVSYVAEPGRLYRCPLKSAQSGTEVWVSSFYRIQPKQFSDAGSKGKVLRAHL